MLNAKSVQSTVRKKVLNHSRRVSIQFSEDVWIPKNWNFEPKKTPKTAYLATPVSCGNTYICKKKIKSCKKAAVAA